MNKKKRYFLKYFFFVYDFGLTENQFINEFINEDKDSLLSVAMNQLTEKFGTFARSNLNDLLLSQKDGEIHRQSNQAN